MSYWNAKYTNNNGEYEITFASKDYEKAKAVEKVCCAVIDKSVKSPLDVEAVVRCRECKHMIPQSHTRYCTVWNAVNGMGDEGFCNYGERKEGAD